MVYFYHKFAAGMPFISFFCLILGFVLTRALKQEQRMGSLMGATFDGM